MKVHLRTLGQLDLRGPDGAELRSVLVQPKRVALLTYLAVARPKGFHRRDSLLALLWPDQDTEHARGALRQALYGLRRSLGAGVLLTRGEDVAIAPDGLTCDVWSFEKAVREGAAAEAVELYGGEFLTGFFLAGAPELEHWVEAERSRLSRTFAETLERLAEETSGLDPARALGYWRRLAEHAPYTPRSALRLMQALEAAGDAPSAIRHAEEYATLLREELDAESDAEVSAFAERLRKRPVSVPPRAFPAAPIVGPADTPTPLPEAQPLATDGPAAPPAARREREHRVRDFLTGGGLGVLVGVPAALVVAGALHALVPGAVPLSLPGSMVAVALAIMLAETAGATWLLRRERGTAPQATRALRAIPTRLFARSSGRMGAGAGFMLGVLVSLSASYSLAPRPEPMPPRASARLWSAPDDTVRRRVAITRFANLTGDPTYEPIGRMAEDWVSRRLRSTPEAEVVGSGAGTLADTSAESVDALARQMGADVIVFGRYYREGTDVLLDARLVPPRGGRVPREIAALAIGPVRAPRDRPVAGTERLAAIVAGALAWCRGAECTVPGRRPPTYAAYRLFRDGMQARRTGEIEKALQNYRSAIAQDSTYGQAYRALAVQSECPQKDSIGEILEVRRQEFAEFDLLYMRAERAHCHGDVEAVYRYARRIYELAPDVPGSRAGVAVGAVHSGRLAEAERRLESLGTDLRPVDYATLGSALHLQGKIEEELRAAAEGRRRFPAEEISAYFGWPGVAARGRPQDLEARIEETRRAGASLPGTAALYLDMAQELDWHGHTDAARQFAARALQEFDRIPQAQRVMFWPVRVRALMQLGRWGAAHQLVDSVAVHDRWAITLRGVTAATAGDRAAARAALSALARLPDSAFADYPAREVCEAAVLAARGDKAEALRRLANGQARRTLPRSDPQYAHAMYLLRPLWHDPRLDRMFAARD